MTSMNFSFKPVLLTLFAATLTLPVHAEPKENIYGKDQSSAYEAGWPFRVNPPNRLGAFDGRALKALYADKPVWIQPSAVATPLDKAPVKFGFMHNPADLLKKHPIMGMALGKNGKLVFEQYQYGTSASSMFDSQSIAKIITGFSLGALIQQGTAIDLDARMGALVPRLQGSAIASATLRQTLNMQCGHDFKWVDDGIDGSAARYAAVRFAAKDKGGRDLYAYYQELPANPPGKTFAYDPHCSDSLSMLITEKTGMPLRRFFEQAVWQKLGTSNRAAWLSPSQNPELTTGSSGFYATLPDYALLANLMVNGGSANGVVIASPDWVKRMYSDTVAVPRSENDNFARYGYQAWVRSDKADTWFAGLGNHGQRFYLDPRSNSFMIIFALDFDHIKDSDKFWEWFRNTPIDKL